jgi:hypothetical protein
MGLDMGVAGHGKGQRQRTGGAAARGAQARPAVDAEQRRHLIEACAFFRAEQFRPCEPGEIRGEDVRAAAAEIDAVIRPVRKRSKR